MKIKNSKLKIQNSKIEELRGQLVRALADYDNLRKRAEEEKQVWLKFSTQNMLVKLLPVLDTLESAQAHLKDQGLGIVIAQFKELLRQEGLEEINPTKGDRFNPEVHEALESTRGGKHGEVAETILSGWKFRDGPVVRVAKVKVYGEKVEKTEEKELEKEMARGEYM